MTCDGVAKYAVKIYFRHGGDNRDRLGVEFGSLKFLWEHGVRCIPQPVTADRDRGYAVYEYIKGTRISPPTVTAADIDGAVRFLVILKELAFNSDSSAIFPASEAVFSARDLLGYIEQRVARLQVAAERHQELRQFLDRDFISSFELMTDWCRSYCDSCGLPWEAEIRAEERTLSPSDFGFHNALRRSGEEIVFLDFEYFGWDDPAKMLSDFLLHPGMELPEILKQRFLTSILSSFGERKRLKERVKILYPLIGLNWCLRLLNEFLPEELLKRSFARGRRLNKDQLQSQQMIKACNMLRRMKSEYSNFPYSL